MFTTLLQDVLSNRHGLFQQKFRKETTIFLERRSQILLCLKSKLQCTPLLHAIIQALLKPNPFKSEYQRMNCSEVVCRIRRVGVRGPLEANSEFQADIPRSST